MSSLVKRCLFVAAAMFLLLSLGCQTDSQKDDSNPAKSVDMNNTIGAFADVFFSDPGAVRGFGIVAGLHGTGSSECPPDLRAVLSKYIIQRVTEKSRINPEINHRTAGLLPNILM